MSRLLRKTFIGGSSSAPVTPSILLAADDAIINQAQGTTVDINLTITRTNTTATVSLSVSGLPSGVTSSFSDSTLTSGETTSVLTLTISAGASIVSSSPFTISATASGLTQSDVNGTITVTSSSTAPTWQDEFTSYADTAALQAVLTANSVYRVDSIDKAYCEIDTSVTYNGHQTLKYNFVAPQRTPQLVKSIAATTEGWLQVPIRWQYGWATQQSEYGSYQGGPKYFDTATVNTTTDTVTITGHGQSTGSRVRYFNNGGTSIGGLSNATDYYMIVVDSNTVKFASSSVNATAGTAIDLTSTGSGTNQYISITPSASSYKMMGFGTVSGTRFIFITTNGNGDLGALGNTQECQLEGNIPVDGGGIIFNSPSVGATGQIGGQFYTNTFWVYTLHFKKVNNDCHIMQGWIHEEGTAPSSGKYVYIRWQGAPGDNNAHSINSILVDRNYNNYRARDQYLNIGHIKYWDATSVPDPLGLGDDESVLPYFTIDAASYDVTVARGGSTNITININTFNGWASSYGTNTGADPSDPPQLPSGVTATYSPASPSVGATSVTLTISATAGATPQTTTGHPFFVYGNYVSGSSKYACNGAIKLNVTVT